jgi:molybdenum cofactor biosynthesis protein MoaC
MKDISGKISTLRTARAEARLKASPQTIELLQDGKIPKGDPLPVAKVAAVQAAKNTSAIIPYCHPLPVDYVGVDFEVNDSEIVVRVEVKAIYKTGVEMEALTAAAAAALTLYDMMKMLDDEMVIDGIVLLEKRGGKSDFKDRLGKTPLKAAVVVMSDSVAAGKKQDASGKLICERLRQEGIEVVNYQIVPDEEQAIERLICAYADGQKLDLVVTTGGTGLSPRDCTPEAIARLLDRTVPGIAEAARAYGQNRTPYAMLSRSQAGLRGRTLIITLPGSKTGTAESLDALFPGVLHAFHMMRAGEHNECR